VGDMTDKCPNKVLNIENAAENVFKCAKILLVNANTIEELDEPVEHKNGCYSPDNTTTTTTATDPLASETIKQNSYHSTDNYMKLIDHINTKCPTIVASSITLSIPPNYEYSQHFPLIKSVNSNFYNSSCPSNMSANSHNLSKCTTLDNSVYDRKMPNLNSIQKIIDDIDYIDYIDVDDNEIELCLDQLLSAKESFV
jgi:hypothetical protein